MGQGGDCCLLTLRKRRSQGMVVVVVDVIAFYIDVIGTDFNIVPAFV